MQDYKGKTEKATKLRDIQQPGEVGQNNHKKRNKTTRGRETGQPGEKGPGEHRQVYKGGTE